MLKFIEQRQEKCVPHSSEVNGAEARGFVALTSKGESTSKGGATLTSDADGWDESKLLPHGGWLAALHSGLGGTLSSSCRLGTR